MDHHCHWIGCCIGKYNRKPFVLTLAYGSLLMALTAAVELPSFLGQFRAEIFTAPAAFSASLLAIAAYVTLLVVGSLTAALLTFQA